MTNPNDLYITFSGFGHKDQIIDSYELIQNLINELGGQANLQFLIENTLPLIQGDPDYINGVFRDFISKTIKEFKGLSGFVKVVHLKDPKSWIFSFFINKQSIPFKTKSESRLTETISEFNLAISKKELQSHQDIPDKIQYL